MLSTVWFSELFDRVSTLKSTCVQGTRSGKCSDALGAICAPLFAQSAPRIEAIMDIRDRQAGDDYAARPAETLSRLDLCGALFNATGNIPGHAIAAVRAL